MCLRKKESLYLYISVQWKWELCYTLLKNNLSIIDVFVRTGLHAITIIFKIHWVYFNRFEWLINSFSLIGISHIFLKSLSRVWLLATPWTAAHQAPPSMGFSRQECWSRVPLPSPIYFKGLFYFILLIFWPCCTAHRVLVPWPEIKSMSHALEAQSLNHWEVLTSRQVSLTFIFKHHILEIQKSNTLNASVGLKH